MIGIQTTERNGKLVRAVLLGATDEVLLISDGGTLVRTRGSEISRVGRNTQGVTLIRLSKGESCRRLNAWMHRWMKWMREWTKQAQA